MRVVGLISGGKDSIWNLHYCSHFGHELTCVAHLAPPTGVQELDSYMYQTVGSELVEAIADALGVPLLIRTITGAPRETAAQAYSPSDGDEVEDLTLLLKDVLAAHPDVQAVSCGAILSNYQRLRVENVCGRLGLKVLAFMWMQEQPVLLRQMIDSSLDARIVKVASMGLSRKHVGKSILDPAFADYVFGLGDKWGVHVCGEGGEYESTVVDGPLFRKRVCINGSDVIDHEDGGDDVAFLRATSVGTEAKASAAHSPPFAALESYSSLCYYQESFPIIIAPTKEAVEVRPRLAYAGGDASSATARPPVLRRASAELWASSSLDAASFGLPLAGAGGPATPGSQCEALLGAVAAWLGKDDCGCRSLRDAVFSEVQVSDMSCFDEVNSVYARHFGHEPPPRLCIETHLPEGVHLRLRLLLRDSADTPVDRLRVQSISTWAMACIGPYSQAARVGPSLMTAGFIGLIPHTMSLPTAADAQAALRAAGSDEALGDAEGLANWEAELWLTMRSLRSVLTEMRSSFGEICVANVYVADKIEGFAGEVCERVLAYIRRDAAEADPLLTCVVVPGLPKGGLVEVSAVCQGRGEEEAERVAPTVSRSSSPAAQGVVSARRRAGPGAGCVASVDFAFAGDGQAPESLAAEPMESAARACVQQLLESLNADTSSVTGITVQHAVTGENGAVEAAVQKALQEAGLGAACLTSCMPVTALPPNGLLRLSAGAEPRLASE